MSKKNNGHFFPTGADVLRARLGPPDHFSSKFLEQIFRWLVQGILQQERASLDYDETKPFVIMAQLSGEATLEESGLYNSLRQQIRIYVGRDAVGKATAATEDYLGFDSVY